MILYSNKSIENANRDRKRKLGYNPSAVIKSVKDFKED
jgi:hypothetical protein